ncbi:MAG: anti-sigma factor family protein, partial [Acidobacteriota bacterium]
PRPARLVQDGRRPPMKEKFQDRDHTQLEELVSAWLDGECDEKEADQVRAHLENCSSCRADLESYREMGTTLKHLAVPPPLPSSLRQGAGGRDRRPLRRRRLIVVGSLLAAGAVLGLVSFMAARSRRPQAPSPTPNLVAAMLADHERYVPAHQPWEVASADAARIARWFDPRLPFQVSVPHLQGARLLGARRCTLAGRPTALMFYEKGGRRLSLFELHDPDGRLVSRLQAREGGPSDCRPEAGGVSVCTHRSGPLFFALVSDLDTAAMAPLLRQTD